MSTPRLLEIRDLCVTFDAGERAVHAVRHCSLDLDAGETLALVGESGSGKSTLARTLAGIVTPTSGQVLVNGRDPAQSPSRERRELRRRIQMVFQDPDASLNPLHRIGEIVAEPLIVRGQVPRSEIQREVSRLLALVKLDPGLAAERPRNLSGGQKQRVAIARALAMEPQVLIADEALASLDVSTAAAIGDLFLELGRQLRIALLFISHDLARVRRLPGRVAVMFGGEIVEQGESRAVLTQPAHPYTRLLIASMPDPARRALDLELVDAIDRLPSWADTPGACHYRARCIRRADVCATGPSLAPLASRADHLARCHFRDLDTPP